MKLHDKITGYVWRGDTYCKHCMKRQLKTAGLIQDDGRPLEDILDVAAWSLNLNRKDEWSFDSWNFPKVVLQGDAEFWPDACSICRMVV